jgi:hypothetical protein
MIRAEPIALWDCGTQESGNPIKNDSCVMFTTQMHIPFRARYNGGGMHGNEISALVMRWDGSFTRIMASKGIKQPRQIQEEEF